MRISYSAILLVVVGCGSALSCHAGAGAEAARPKNLTYADAVEPEACRNPSESGQPMIVDWPQNKRADLEAVLRQGVAVAHYDCKSFELLAECSATGSYGFLGITRKEQVIRLQNADEIRANLPFGGPLLAKQLGAGLGTSTSLDVALVMVGKLSSTRLWVGHDELPSACARATHFVRRATVGAFAMTSSSEAHVEATAAMFASVKSASARSVKNTDGDLAQCQKASTKAEAPPDQCGAALRLELFSIVDKSPKDVPTSDGRTIEGGCPEGLALSDNACRARVAGKAHLCDSLDYKDCTAQCGLGHADSCVNLAFMYDGGVADQNGKEIVIEDESMARDLLAKSCDLGSSEGCGYVMSEFRRAPSAPDKALALVRAACDGGESRACNFLGRILVFGLAGVPEDTASGYKALQRACDGGALDACMEAAPAFAQGKGVEKDLLVAVTMWIRGCEAGRIEDCKQAAGAFERGEGVAKDKKRAGDLHRRACEHGKRTGQKVDDDCAAAKSSK